MDILIALIPALMWGSILLVASKLGGEPDNQVVGTTFGALLFAIGVFFFISPDFTLTAVIVSFISGLLWSLGQMNQFKAVTHLGVSKTLPISTGLQLIGTSLFGVLVFGEWSSTMKLIIGISALIIIIIGVVFTSYQQKDEEDKDKQSPLTKGIPILLISTAGYVGYVVVIRWFSIDGWTAVLPQSVGMVVGAVFLSIKEKPFSKYTLRNLIPGFMWAAGNLALLLSIPRVGTATSFSLSQTGIIISTLGGIFLLGEKKTKKQMIFVIIGCVLIIIGGVMLGFTKK
ncbi:glucose uptake protein [Halobacillus karajensis]|uniref:Glucose uptake protein GlcU n=1 Tax=Halobacillus karajensis TaxID=195088 RepID=A0A024P4J5_9BACI|nr:GRP family sugar transporter [Halobacillus karajensis]CDQ20730.1 putative glucose uptake protein GlcU [Halobacillus karajensis]CDQ23800.1 putative glucose uptake protein GlcU [Halobacillus karajensis]CDQ27278.1 putative glucose uptake protein GlcU [Halobacillus karajensis]SEI05191.1 glucose uptake protein [Halobacillus karajensis]